jgi:hypothetical protein
VSPFRPRGCFGFDFLGLPSEIRFDPRYHMVAFSPIRGFKAALRDNKNLVEGIEGEGYFVVQSNCKWSYFEL